MLLIPTLMLLIPTLILPIPTLIPLIPTPMLPIPTPMLSLQRMLILSKEDWKKGRELRTLTQMLSILSNRLHAWQWQRRHNHQLTGRGNHQLGLSGLSCTGHALRRGRRVC